MMGILQRMTDLKGADDGQLFHRNSRNGAVGDAGSKDGCSVVADSNSCAPISVVMVCATVRLAANAKAGTDAVQCPVLQIIERVC